MSTRDTNHRAPHLGPARWLAAVLAAACALPAAHAATDGGRDDVAAEAVESLAAKLEARFVDPAIGRRYARTLRTNLAAGRYDGLEAKPLATRLTDDLQAVAADGHLRVDLAPPGAPASGAAPGGARPSAPALPSVAETRWLADGVAYLRFNQFAGEPASVAAMRAFVTDYAGAKAVIIDTRTLTRGGGLAEMDVLFPQLYARETLLVEMAVARDDGDVGGPALTDRDTLREAAGPPGMLVRRHYAVPDPNGPRLEHAKVFYLTSKRTRSAGEHFALALKRTRRGTLVGEATAGANHFGRFEPIGDGSGLVAFIPVGRTYDPDTGKDWEGAGVSPDVEVPVDEALERALALARE